MSPTLTDVTWSVAALGGVFVTIVVAFLGFLLTRELWCWYWKVNAAMEELRAIRGLLETIVQRSQPSAEVLPPPLPIRAAK